MKRLLVASSVACLAMVASACGGNSSSEGSASTGALPDTVTVGALLPLTGPGADTGQQMLTGLELWAEDFNKSAKDKGLPEVKIASADSEADASTGIQAYQQLKSQSKVELVYSTYTNVGTAVAPFATRDKVAVMQAAQGNITPELGPTFTQALPSEKSEFEATIPEAVKAGAKRIAAVVIKNDKAYHDEAETLKTDTCPKEGCEIVKVVEEEPDGSDGKLAAIQALSSKPDAIVVWGTYVQTGPVLQQLRTAGFSGLILSDAGFDETVAKAGTGNASVQNAIFPRFYVDMDKRETKEFFKEYEAKRKTEPLGYATEAYVGGQLIGAAIEYMDEEKLAWTGPNIVKAQLAVVDFRTS